MKLEISTHICVMLIWSNYILKFVDESTHFCIFFGFKAYFQYSRRMQRIHINLYKYIPVEKYSLCKKLQTRMVNTLINFSWIIVWHCRFIVDIIIVVFVSFLLASREQMDQQQQWWQDRGVEFVLLLPLVHWYPLLLVCCLDVR